MLTRSLEVRSATAVTLKQPCTDDSLKILSTMENCCRADTNIAAHSITKWCIYVQSIEKLPVEYSNTNVVHAHVHSQALLLLTSASVTSHH